MLQNLISDLGPLWPVMRNKVIIFTIGFFASIIGMLIFTFKQKFSKNPFKGASVKYILLGTIFVGFALATFEFFSILYLYQKIIVL